MLRCSLCLLLCLGFGLAVPLMGQSIGQLEYINEEPDYQNSHKVLPGENLYSISRQYGLSVEEVRAMNGLSDNTIFPGQRLIVKSEQMPAGATMRLAPAAETTQAPVGYTQLERRQYYQVRNGDKIEELANRYRVSSEQIRDWNAISEIYPGQTLIVEKWYETVDVATLRGSSPANANARISRGQEEVNAAAQPVANLSIFTMGPFTPDYNRTGDRAGEPNSSYRTAAPAQPANRMENENGWLMERPSYEQYRRSSYDRAASTSNMRSADPAPQAKFGEVEVSGPYDVFEDRYRGNANPFYAFHDELPVGTRVQIQIPGNAGFIEVEVIGAKPRGLFSMIVLSPAAAKIVQGSGERDNRVTIRY